MRRPARAKSRANAAKVRQLPPQVLDFVGVQACAGPRSLTGARAHAQRIVHVGLPATHSASFRRYIRERFLEPLAGVSGLHAD